MATTEIVEIFKDLANRPTVSSRQMEYTIERIEKELQRRIRSAKRKVAGL